MVSVRSKIVRLLAVIFALSVLTAPVDLHSNPVESSVYLPDGPISVGARHGGQQAHFEHSETELRSPCVACLLSGQSKVVVLKPNSQTLVPLKIGNVFPVTSNPFVELLSSSAPSRAPPTL